MKAENGTLSRASRGGDRAILRHTNVAQSWTVIGVLGPFGLAMVGLMSPFLVAKVDRILARVTTSEERLGTRMDRLETRMGGLHGRIDGLDGRMDGLDGKFDRLDRDVQAIADRVFRDEP